MIRTLGELAAKYDVKLTDRVKNMVIREIVESDGNMYFSGVVVLHISVEVDFCGLNNTGAWPYYLVNDEGVFKILEAS